MNREVEKFISKSKQWQEEIKKLRSIILATKLEENFKWRLPCCSYEDSNVVIIQPFKSCLGLMFFKGALLKDVKGIIHFAGAKQSATRVSRIEKCIPRILAGKGMND